MLELPLAEKAEGENVPVEVTFQFQEFKVEQKLQRVRASEASTAAEVAAPTSTTVAAAQQKDKSP